LEGHTKTTCKAGEVASSSSSSAKINRGQKRGPKKRSQIAVDDDGVSDNGFESDGSGDEAEDEAEVEDHSEEPELPIDLSGVQDLDGNRLKYELINSIPTFDLTVEDENGELQIDKEKIAMANVPPFLPKSSHYVPGSVKNLPPDFDATPGDFLGLLISKTILDTWVEASNAYAAAKARKKDCWQDLDVPMLRSFISIILFLGLVKYPSVDDAWVGKGSGTWLPSIMSKWRFQMILQNWHWIDTSQFTAAERKVKNKEKPFWAVDGFISLLSENFSNCYSCGQFLDVDEQCFPFKGRHRCRCYNPSKPHKWHFKAFALNCALTGYQFKHFMYEGKDAKRDDMVRVLGRPASATEYPVLSKATP